VQVPRPPQTPETFWARVDKTGACWLWLGATKTTRRGYGNVKWHGKVWIASRLAYMLTHGPIPENMQIDHTCRNTACVRPSHLEAVTHQVNQQRGVPFRPKTRKPYHRSAVRPQL